MITQETPKRIEDVARPKLRGPSSCSRRGYRVPGKVVSERLAHASAVITLGTYPHTLPGMQREAASELAAMVLGS